MEKLNFLKFKRRRLFTYQVCLGFAAGLSKERQLFKYYRSNEWWDKTVLQTFNDNQWTENFRMRKGTFEEICTSLEDSLKAADRVVRKPVDVQKQVAITLYWLASSSEYRTVGNLFGVAKSTVHDCVHKVCTAFVDILLPEYVRFPKGDNLKDVVRGYEERWGFPNCGGCIDGSHIPIKAPTDSHGDYLNRKGFYSLILQGTCDYRYIFRDINIGWPGRVHDARVFANSEIYHRGEYRTLFPNWLKTLPLPDGDVSMPIVLLGDPAYPLKPWLLKPYTNRGSLTVSQSTFNYRLSRARMTIENSFGRLKGRWRCLQTKLEVDVEFACTVIAACVVLHNICEMHNERYSQQWDTEPDVDEDAAADQNIDEEGLNAKKIRDDLANAFTNNIF